MNRKEAADFLGVSEKSISRYVSGGRLSAQRMAGALDIARDELEAFKTQMNQAVPAVADAGQDETPAETQDRTGQTSLSQAPEGASLAHPSDQTGGGAGGLVLVLESAEAVRELGKTLAGQGTGQDTSVPLAQKKTLSLLEAALLSGVPESILRVAVKEERLQAVKVGRGRRVLPADLDAFVLSLFERKGLPATKRP